MGRSCSQNGRGSKILTGTPVRKRPLGRPRCRYEDYVRMDLKEIDINTRNWVDSDKDRTALVNAALNLLVPYAIELVNTRVVTVMFCVTYTCAVKAWPTLFTT